MKKSFFITTGILFSMAALSQVPMEINYQGIARNSSGNTLTNQNISLRLSVHDVSGTGTILYQEARDIKTDRFGMFVVAIGSSGATYVQNSLQDINWLSGNSKYLQVEISPKNDKTYIDLGSAQLLSVPYALSAQAANPVGNAGGSLSGIYPNPQIAAKAINTYNIADSAITSSKIADRSVTASKLSIIPAGGDLTGIFPNPLIADGVVNTSKLANDGVTAAKIKDGSITLSKLDPNISFAPTGAAGGALTGNFPNPTLSSNVVNTNNIVDGSITTSKIADRSLTMSKFSIIPAGGDLTGIYPNPIIADGVVYTTKLADNAVTTAKILDGSVTASKLASGIIPASLPPNGTASGDLSGSYPSPKVIKLNGITINNTTPALGQVIKFDGTQWSPSADNTGSFSIPYSSSATSSSNLFSVTNQGTGSAIEGINSTVNPNAVGVIGRINSTTPGISSAAVKGINNGTGANGYGVWGSHNGGGSGIYGSSVSGNGISGFSNDGYGVYANSTNGNGIFATSNNGTPGLFDISNSGSYSDALFTSNAGSGNGITSIATLGNGILGIGNDAYGTGILGINNAGGEAILGFTISDNGSAIVGRNDGTYAAVRGFNTSNNGIGVLAIANSWGATNGTALIAELEGSNAGNTAIFKANNTNVARIDNTGKGFFNGGTQMGGADIAEYFAVEGDHSKYEAGDVLIISQNSDRTVEKSSTAYSNLIAGVFATKPGVLLTEENAEKDALDLMAPMGVIGVLPTKVCIEGGAIMRGDLLVTSSITGVAMKADINRVKVGQVLGKALQAFSENGVGKINVLVSVK
ncbi:MAG: hypothetical protein ABI419_05240 [Ginsengibacter sp.]